MLLLIFGFTAGFTSPVVAAVCFEFFCVLAVLLEDVFFWLACFADGFPLVLLADLFFISFLGYEFACFPTDPTFALRGELRALEVFLTGVDTTLLLGKGFLGFAEALKERDLEVLFFFLPSGGHFSVVKDFPLPLTVFGAAFAVLPTKGFEEVLQDAL